MVKPDKAVDPVLERVAALDVTSAVSVGGHPIHAMSVSFPIALITSTLGCDLFYWWTADPFWARAALWASGFAIFFGLIAGASGTLELLLVPGIRKRVASWTHAVIAVVLLSIAGLNWGLRLEDHVAAVLPLGLMVSALATLFVALAGWHGGKLVFDHGIGLMISDRD